MIFPPEPLVVFTHASTVKSPGLRVDLLPAVPELVPLNVDAGSLSPASAPAAP
jgi:hypothetical protein